MRMQDVYAASGGIVLEKRSWQRRDYRIEELKRWSERLGMIVNIEPSYFPVDVDLASCMVIAAQNQGLNVDALANAMMRAIWVEDENLADRDTLLRTADRAGYDGLTLLEGRQVLPAWNTYPIPLAHWKLVSLDRRSMSSKANGSGGRIGWICLKSD